MAKLKKFNLNHYMYIQINKSGWEYLKKTVSEDYINYCILPKKFEFKSQVWYKLQTHEVFTLFPISLRFDSYIGTNVMFDEMEDAT